MGTKAWTWLLFSLGFEILGDVAVKKESWVLAWIGYNLMLFTWFKTVSASGQMITVPGVIWLIGGELCLVLLGAIVFRESLSLTQWVGISLGGLSLFLMSFGGK